MMICTINRSKKIREDACSNKCSITITVTKPKESSMKKDELEVYRFVNGGMQAK
ncbi:hypothetical protein Mzhil_1515 [Methanosalsum zhilinae DSM 4017]|uniref:Uncharacterized protein n=1 Tax=Methanosalsum zhilinae (strain DSM 4017 / NBRC 107636 / OCM 62 / WeN5) TaxID=679901 RepID=F7XP62_METZD|nr:hypothetical protein [Methanosalsum zhilinae]AEH61354.1 hypothetical protein Mzhil_1515 [Methanosalsum zhilinae DSM 4017]